MAEHHNIQMDLVKMADGGRLLRLTDARSGLALEQVLDPQQPVVRQKEKLLRVFEAALARAELTAA